MLYFGIPPLSTFSVHITKTLTWVLLSCLCCDKDKTETVSPQTLTKFPGIPSNTEKILLLHHQEHPDRKHHRLKQHQKSLQDPAKMNSFSWTYNKWCSTSLKDIYARNWKTKARRIFMDPYHLGNGIFSLLRWGRRSWIHQPALWGGASTLRSLS